MAARQAALIPAAANKRPARGPAIFCWAMDLLDVARRWRHLAERYQFVDGVDQLLAGQRPRHAAAE
jgi:hypothetical protein